MAEKNKVVHISGKRKMSVARATVKKGTGIIRINNVNLEVYPNDLARDKIKEPLIIAGGLAKEINISVEVNGGGIMSRAEAARNAIARGLVEYTKDKDLRKTYLSYDRHLLIADTRRTEPHKPCRSGARSGKQTSKR